MKVECIKEKIKDTILLAEKMTGRNLTLPVLSSILLIAEKNTLKLRATNLDLGIEITISAKVKEEGIVAVSGTLISNLIANLYTDSLILEKEENFLRITTKNTSARIKIYQHEDFPTLPKIQKGISFSIEARKFVDGLKAVWFSASHSDIKPEISTVYIYSEGDDLVFVATDSFRLAEKKIKAKIEKKDLSLLIPLKNIAEIIRVFDGILGDVMITFDKNQISFSYESIYITSRIIEGIFPDYKQILPKEFSTEVIVLKKEFFNALKINNLFTDKFNQITIEINPQKKVFTVSSKNIDVGENSIQVDAALIGIPITLNFNHRYIMECLQGISKDSVSLNFNGENRPLVIQGIGEKTFTYLVMPLNQ